MTNKELQVTEQIARKCYPDKEAWDISTGLCEEIIIGDDLELLELIAPGESPCSLIYNLAENSL